MNDLRQADSLFAQNKIAEAEILYRRVLTADANVAGAYWGLGRIAMRAQRFETAISMFAQVSRLLPVNCHALISLGDAYAELRHFEFAGKCYARAVEVAPGEAQAHYAYGLHLSSAGAAAQAEERLRAALKLDPSHSFAYAAIAQLKLYSTVSDGDIIALNDLLDKADLPPAKQMAAHYALGKAYYDIGEKNAAMTHFEKANGLQRSRVSFSVSDMRPFFNSIKNTFTSKILKNKNSQIEFPHTPIFIVGQPRSGSTLLEQMLGRHTEIFAAGELPFVGREVAGALSNKTNMPFPESCACLPPDQLSELAMVYFDAVKTCAPGYRYVTDKLPANFQSVGLIYMLMPNAKIINLRRHPMDMGFSIYRNFFNEDEPYFCSMTEIGEYHRIYEDIIAHWRENLPGFVLDIKYEELIADPQKTLSEVLEFCGLAWQDACLAPHETGGYVRTLSGNQVRQKLHSRGLNASKPYEPFLKSLRDSLQDTVDNYDS